MRAALINAQGIFLRMVDVDHPTEFHLTQITECDLPPGKYKWIADTENQFGGAFWPVAWLARREQDKLDVAAAAQAAQTLAARRAARKIVRDQEELDRQGQ